MTNQKPCALKKETCDLPSHLSISSFSAARAKEIQIMKNALQRTTGIKLVFQKLPKHMRRRAMSHNVKRLPRRLREIHMNQMKKSGLPPKQKRPSRKYRRRPYNLSNEYARRQRRVTWLNTHIWHAKRFHMVEKWNYKLPFSPCDKAFRACYRATIKHCLLQDISYYNCIEIKGDLLVLLSGFKHITNSTTGLSFGAKSYISGYREGSITLFKYETNLAIGPVNFNWKPVHSCETTRTLWIWVHPAFYSEVLNSLRNCFSLEKNCLKNDQVDITELKYDLSRFRLTGPLSTAVLQNALKLININNINENDWMKIYFKNNHEPLLAAENYWNTLKSISLPVHLSPHIVVPLVIQDPRFNLPKRRTKSQSIYESNHSASSIPKGSFHDSPIWDKQIRKVVSENKISQFHLAKLRETLLVPGSDLDEKPATLPILLIQRPGTWRYSGYGNGWDIIIPSSWAQPLWITLIMWGGRAGGLRETNCIDFESERQFLHPDTKSGKNEEDIVTSKATEAFFKLPPNKRINYNKFNIASPFRWNWNMLIKEWNCSESFNEEFCVLRDKHVLSHIQMFLKTKTKEPIPMISKNCLIPVSIHFAKKGSCKQFAIICLPQEEDLKTEPVEQKCEDPNEKLRKQMRKEHKMLLKRLRRRRIRAKKDGKIIPIDKEMLKNYTSKMRKLWIPETTNIRNSCSREIMGFVKHGDFSFLQAKTKALGYITGGSLIKLLSQIVKNKVLIRNTNSRQYRLGILDICEV